MAITRFDVGAQYSARFATWKQVCPPGGSRTVVVNIVIDRKLDEHSELPPEGVLAKQHFSCDARWVPNHPSVGVLKQLVNYTKGKRFPWDKLSLHTVVLRFGAATERGCHNPVVEIQPLLAPRVDYLNFTVSCDGKVARFTDGAEFRLIATLIERRGKWLTHSEIEHFVLDDPDESISNRVCVLKCRVAKRLRDHGLGPLANLIQSTNGKYRLAIENHFTT